MRGLKTGGIGFGIATALAVIALLILGGRGAIVLSSPGARAMPILSKVGPAEPFRATPVISQDSSPIPAAERKANAREAGPRVTEAGWFGSGRALGRPDGQSPDACDGMCSGA